MPVGVQSKSRLVGPNRGLESWLDNLGKLAGKTLRVGVEGVAARYAGNTARITHWPRIALETIRGRRVLAKMTRAVAKGADPLESLAAVGQECAEEMRRTIDAFGHIRTGRMRAGCTYRIVDRGSK